LISEQDSSTFLHGPLICKGATCQTRARFVLLHPTFRGRISLADERWLVEECWRRLVRYQLQVDAQPYLGARSTLLAGGGVPAT